MSVRCSLLQKKVSQLRLPKCQEHVSAVSGPCGLLCQCSPVLLYSNSTRQSRLPVAFQTFAVVGVSFIVRETEVALTCTSHVTTDSEGRWCLVAASCFKERPWSGVRCSHSQLQLPGRRASVKHLSITCRGGAARPSPCSLRPPVVG